MRQDERLDYLIKRLMAENGVYNERVNAMADRRVLLRSLMNRRLPKATTREFLEIQDAYLQEEAQRKGITSCETILSVKDFYKSTHLHADKIALWQGDITTLKIEAIVNAANLQMLGCFIPNHRCIDNAIHTGAGMQLRQVCHEYMETKRKQQPNYIEPTGGAVITPAYNLPSQYVIHTVGPIVYDELTAIHIKDLQSCYESVLNIAIEKGIRCLAFCCISTGEFCFPNREAAEIAVATVIKSIEQHPSAFDKIVFNVYKDEDFEIYKQIFLPK